MTKASGARKKRRTDHRMVHHLVATTAKEIAGVYYEQTASNGTHGNTFYEAFPDQKTFIKDQWPMFVMTAKDIMTTMLANPLTPEAQRQDIYHALLLDATLPYSPPEAQITNFRVH
jgi:hypothetical protein